MSSIINCGNRYLLLKDKMIEYEDITDEFIDEYIIWCEFSNELCKRMTKEGSKEDWKDAQHMCKIISEGLENAKSLKDLKKLSFKFNSKARKIINKK